MSRAWSSKASVRSPQSTSRKQELFTQAQCSCADPGEHFVRCLVAKTRHKVMQSRQAVFTSCACRLMHSSCQPEADVSIRPHHASHEVELDLGRFIHQSLQQEMQTYNMSWHFSGNSLQAQVQDLLVGALLVARSARGIRKDAGERIQALLSLQSVLPSRKHRFLLCQPGTSTHDQKTTTSVAVYWKR